MRHWPQGRDLPASPAIHGTLHGSDIGSDVVIIAGRGIRWNNLLNRREMPRIYVDIMNERVPRNETRFPRRERRKAIVAGSRRDTAQIAQRVRILRHASIAK